jgi:RNA polymerase primary sigma factor
MSSVPQDLEARRSSLSIYLREIKGCARPGDGDEHALVKANLGFVVSVARQFLNRGLPLEDLLAEGNLGLLEAARRFDRSHGTKFITYAVWWIRKSILKALSEHGSVPHVPPSHLRKVRDVGEAERALSRELGRSARRDEISDRLQTSVAAVDRILQLKWIEVSLDSAEGPDREGTLSQRLADRRSPDPEADLLKRERRTLVREAVRTLSERERAVLAGRYGLRDGPIRSLREIGGDYGLSREAIRLIEMRAKRRLRRIMQRKGLTLPAARP